MVMEELKQKRWTNGKEAVRAINDVALDTREVFYVPLVAIMTILKDDELEINWTSGAVDPSDNESTKSAGSGDEFEEETELELVSGIKRSRKDEKGEIMNSGDDKNVVKKQKAKEQAYT
ncbi:uncharacterized protein PHALS_09484 [Plasmopara halstedii]|uniref:Uncharacterized protein n=1 Tax=Plasmopara halstedii TaxID=4781 RepID=A0A0P1A594_PLAHL|nr:uncharacterized protein PHALS_09484 [Plasmopara halstedii]CEG35358.1 hypothetical protein PHALS_09484 [Plasmopara halstedii]|eukprot:XP_024571727.1 hypothetical protein PHALS_09484 [Plasmopara halstedii]